MIIKIGIFGPCRDDTDPNDLYHYCDKCYGNSEFYEQTEITVPFWVGFWWKLGYIPKKYLRYTEFNEQYAGIFMLEAEYAEYLQMKSLTNKVK